MESGFETLFKIVSLLVIAIGVVPVIFLFSQGDKSEPAAFGDDQRH